MVKKGANDGGSWGNSHPPSHPAPHLSAGKDFGSRSRGSNHQQLAHYNWDALMDCTGVHPADRMEKMERRLEKDYRMNHSAIKEICSIIAIARKKKKGIKLKMYL